MIGLGACWGVGTAGGLEVVILGRFWEVVVTVVSVLREMTAISRL